MRKKFAGSTRGISTTHTFTSVFSLKTRANCWAPWGSAFPSDTSALAGEIPATRNVGTTTAPTATWTRRRRDRGSDRSAAIKSATFARLAFGCIENDSLRPSNANIRRESDTLFASNMVKSGCEVYRMRVSHRIHKHRLAVCTSVAMEGTVYTGTDFEGSNFSLLRTTEYSVLYILCTEYMYISSTGSLIMLSVLLSMYR
jgi:hypothetical protein